jgi:hypothetical protein
MSVVDDLLQTMHSTLSTHHTDLKRMNKDISNLQESSQGLSVKLENRQKTHQLSQGVLEGCVISPDLIKYVLNSLSTCTLFKHEQLFSNTIVEKLERLKLMNSSLVICMNWIKSYNSSFAIKTEASK